jgi:hypothetical protein
VTAPQLALDEPFPASPEVRQASILAAFAGDRDRYARAGAMQAKRGACPVCSRGLGLTCVVMRRGTLKVMTWPHPSRLALSVSCEVHGVKPWVACPGVQYGVCTAREECVADTVALFVPERPAARPSPPGLLVEQDDF